MPTVFAEKPLAESDARVEVVCDLCGTGGGETIFSCTDRNWPVQSNQPNADIPPEEWSLVRCGNCGLVYLNPRPALETLGRFYPTDYYAYARPPRVTLLNLKRQVKLALRRHRVLFQLVQLTSLGDALHDPATRVLGWVPPGRVLDVGCGAGDALDTCADLGWETWGVEPSQAAAQTAERNGHRIWNGSLEECDVPDSSVDVVRMSHVLEHVPSPTQTLRAVARVLRPGGRFIVEVPHITQLLAALCRDYNWSLDLPRHFYHFGADTLTRVVASAGLRVLRTETLCNPKQILHCLDLAWRDPDGLGQRLNLSLDQSPLRDSDLHRSLVPFCQALAARGQGTSLLLVAEKSAGGST